MKKTHLYICLCLAALLSACTKELEYESEQSRAVFANGEATVTLAEAGTLWEQLARADNLMALTKLTVSGPINGTDLKLIREMAGADSVGNETRGKLEILDISQASLVKGGENPFVYNGTPCPMDEDDAIPRFGFGYCKLREIRLPESIKIFGDQAFFECDSLETINIPASLEEMYNSVFYNCGKLSSPIVVPQSITHINNYTFSGCESLTSITLHDKVTEIGKSAFYGCKKITDLGSSLPALASIGESSFSHCTRLKNAYIPTKMTSIPNYAFNLCQYITSVDLTGKTEIGKYAFSGCARLASAKLSSYVQVIGAYAFANTVLSGTLSLPASMKECGWGSFYSTNITAVEINSDIALGERPDVNIVYNTFGYCKKLRTVKIAEGVTEVNLPFDHCTALTQISFPSTLRRIGEENDLLEYFKRSHLFAYCTALESVSLPEKLEFIGQSAFRGCSNLKSITFPSSMNTIDSYAFIDCTSLTEVTIPEQVEKMGAYIFKGCTSLTKLNMLAPLKEVPQGLFEDCTALKSFTVPATVEKIDYESFKGSGIADITIPEGVSVIGNMAFMNCLSLTKIVYPSSLKNIYDNAFSGCTNLADVTFKDNCALEAIDNGCFYQCSSLQDIVLPQAVQSIGQNAFDTSGLRSIAIPASVTTIGDGCFANCRRLATVTDLATQPQNIQASVFTGVSLPQLTLRVPLSATSSYQGAAVWSGFGQIVGI